MVHGRRTLTVCPAGWRGIVYRYCRDLERGERLVDNGLVPRLLISWRRCVPPPPPPLPSSFFFPSRASSNTRRRSNGLETPLCSLGFQIRSGETRVFFTDFHLAPEAECRLIDGSRIRDACLAGVGGD